VSRIAIHVLSFLSLSLLAFTPMAAADASQPRLVVQITVDQLRGDLPFRYQDRLGAGGFRYFLDHGAWYVAANQPHAFTETVVGHTTLATGAYPARHGMVGNRWYDRTTGRFVNNIEDSRYPILPIRGETPCVPEPEKPCKGVSPTTIQASTIGDELTITTASRAKVFGVSLKDRGAVPMAGHSGKAFWYSGDNGCFVTSSFYYASYPKWVEDWCARRPADAYANSKWNLLHDKSTYVFRDFDNVYPKGTPAEINMQLLVNVYRFGRTFPHTLGPAGPALYNGITLTPSADELTLNFAQELIKNEQLGKDDIPDYLSISFSVTDYVGHWFSPSSLESEDNLLRLDQTLARLIAFLDSEVGLDRTLLVLSADHGGPEYPEYLKTIHVNTGRIAQQAILDAAKAAVTPRYGEGIILEYAHPYFYLDRDLIARKGYNQLEIERVIAGAVMRLDGIKMAVPSNDMSGAAMGDTESVVRIQRNYDTTRSGDVYVLQELQWQVDSDPAKEPPLLQHDALWEYDTYVPVAFAGFGIPHARVARGIETVDVAATLSTVLRTKYPSGCVGVPLKEVAAPR